VDTYLLQKRFVARGWHARGDMEDGFQERRGIIRRRISGGFVPLKAAQEAGVRFKLNLRKVSQSC